MQNNDTSRWEDGMWVGKTKDLKQSAHFMKLKVIIYDTR